MKNALEKDGAPFKILKLGFEPPEFTLKKMSSSIPIYWDSHFCRMESNNYERKLLRVFLYIRIGVMSKCIKCNPKGA